MKYGRRLRKGLVAWAITAAGVRLFIAQPEHCAPVTDASLRHAIDETIAWATRTQGDDGRWIYRYDTVTDRDVAVYELVRHAGLIVALNQAAAAGFEGAGPPAQRANEYARRFLVQRDGWTALGGGDASTPLETGASALWLAALSYESPTDLDTMRGLARFLAVNVFPNGSVAEKWDPATGRPIPDEFSPFFTGETLWALSRMHLLAPTEGWDRIVDRVLHYVATERDEVEGWFPPIPDHWSSYALAEITTWRALDRDEAAYARRVGELESLQIRYESQRTNSWFSKLTRGDQALAAGVGTLTEALGALWRASSRDPRLQGDADVLAERAECAAGLLVERQIDEREAQSYVRPDAVQGTWLHHGKTQIDDQQHAASGLLAVLEIING
ncbi:MAG TPA: hypothetical protein VM282_20860 [Acidimicrobiales bacterium]|nr:hypothetical protein [Acidimicrobiales bacterium]